MPAVLGALFILVPVLGMMTRVDGLSGFWAAVTTPQARTALGLSVRTSLTATACCLLLGVPMALVLARVPFTGQRAIRALVLLPLVLPPVVGGIALLTTFGRRGLLGKPLSLAGIEVGFTTLAVVIAQTFVALPFLVLTLEGALRTRGSAHEDVAATLGASPTRILFLVTIPEVLPAVVSGAVLAFARALGEFGATVTFAGSSPGITQTLPLQIYNERSADPQAAISLSLLLAVLAFAIIIAVYARIGAPERTAPQRVAPERVAPERVAPVKPAAHSEPTTGRQVGRTALGGAADRDAADRDAAGCDAVGGTAQPHALHVRTVIADRGLDVDLSVEPGQVVAVLGENGSGKSTLLHAIAGLLTTRNPTDQLAITVGERQLAHSPAGRSVAVRDRRIGWLGQQPHLFGHLTVLGNVTFGPRATGTGRRGATARAEALLARLDAGHLATRSARHLSGGEAQRVALARALATNPDILLLDEPFSALDVTVAAHVRTMVRHAHRAHPRTTIVVTHDVLDAVLLADRVVVLHNGRIVQDGPTAEVLNHPTSPFAAHLAGLNTLTGRVTRADGNGVTLTTDREAGAANPVSNAGTDGVNSPQATQITGIGEVVAGQVALAVFEPQAVAVHREPVHGSPRNVMPAVIDAVERHGPLFRVWVHLAPASHPPAALGPGNGQRIAADITASAVTQLGLEPGVEVWVAVKAAEVRVYPL